MAGTVKDINDAMAIMWEWAEDMVCDVVIDNPDYTLRDVKLLEQAKERVLEECRLRIAIAKE